MHEYFKLQNKLLLIHLGFSLVIVFLITGNIETIAAAFILTSLSVIPIGLYSHAHINGKSSRFQFLSYWVPVGLWLVYLGAVVFLGQNSGDSVGDIVWVLLKVSFPSLGLTYLWQTSSSA